MRGAGSEAGDRPEGEDAADGSVAVPGDAGEDGDAPADAEPLVDDPIEAGEPTAENVLFVVLGALATLFVVARVAGLL